ncbi:MAG: response regulator [Deltaproteobacteria bacterium]|nr:response regulator [Deltaproteobacteria bacterium]
MKSIGVVDDDSSIRDVLRGLLEGSDYEVVFESSDGIGVVDLCMEKEPDAVIIDVGLPSKDGIELSKEISATSAIPVVLITANREDDILKRAVDCGVMSIIGKPFERADIISSLGFAISRQEELDDLKRENMELRGSLESRRLIEKAKGFLMEERSISEDAAFALIRTRSMNERSSMKDVAKALIEELG